MLYLQYYHFFHFFARLFQQRTNNSALVCVLAFMSLHFSTSIAAVARYIYPRREPKEILQ